MTIMTKAKNCKECDSSAIFAVEPQTNEWRVGCQFCLVYSPPSDLDKAVELWNKMQEPEKCQE